jgi:hypothetical protein
MLIIFDSVLFSNFLMTVTGFKNSSEVVRDLYLLFEKIETLLWYLICSSKWLTSNS